MQEFRSIDATHQFKVDSGVYFLPAYSFVDLEPTAAIGNLKSPADQSKAMDDLLRSRVLCRRGPVLRFFSGWMSPSKALAALSIKQRSDLFKAWASGVGSPGEPSSSAD